MKKLLGVIFIISLSLWLGGCKTNQAKVVHTCHNSQGSLDWAGSYAGVIPAADTEGIDVQLTLCADQSFTLVYNYIGKPGSITKSGKFSWDDTGSIITLKDLDKKAFPTYYKVGENHLLQLDIKGQKITGSLADKYVLKKIIPEDQEYVLKYEWPEKPRVGNYILKVNLTDKTGKAVSGAEVAVSYDMPSMRGHHAATEIMKQNAKGDYLLPIHFAMRGDWEIIISARKSGRKIAIKKILLNI